MLNAIGIEKLQSIKNEYDEIRALEEKERRRIWQEEREKYGFRSAQELIDWVYSGKRISIHSTGDYMELENDKIVHVFMDFDDCVGPLGWTKAYQSKECFENWVKTVLVESMYNGYIDFWYKDKDLV